MNTTENRPVGTIIAVYGPKSKSFWYLLEGEKQSLYICYQKDLPDQKKLPRGLQLQFRPTGNSDNSVMNLTAVIVEDVAINHSYPLRITAEFDKTEDKSALVYLTNFIQPGGGKEGALS